LAFVRRVAFNPVADSGLGIWTLECVLKREGDREGTKDKEGEREGERERESAIERGEKERE